MKKGPKTEHELIRLLIKQWHHGLEASLLKKLIESMPQRCAAVIAAKDGSTQYRLLTNIYLEF